MTIETDVKTVLDNDSGLSALVSDRNYAALLPQNPTYPNTVYHIVDKPPINTLDGTVGQKSAIFQIDCRAETYAGARALAVQVRDALDTTASVKSICLADEDVPYEDGAQVYRVVLRFSVWN